MWYLNTDDGALWEGETLPKAIQSAAVYYAEIGEDYHSVTDGYWGNDYYGHGGTLTLEGVKQANDEYEAAYNSEANGWIAAAEYEDSVGFDWRHSR